MTGSTGLCARNLTVRFGGLVAVDQVSVEAPVGRLTGLIGPNGAGKTTLFNACSGLNQPSGGRVELFCRDVSRRSPVARAQLGLGRTFQRMELFDSLTVVENVRLGREAALTGRRPLLGQLWCSRHDRRDIEGAAEDAISLCGIEALGDRVVGSLPTGQRRLVELARTLAAQFRILLLDEPSSGLDSRESDRFGDILRSVVEDTGVGILLVEHDMALVSRVCEYVYVLDFGKPLFEGTTEQVMSSELVIAAYLGSEAVKSNGSNGNAHV